MNNSGNVLLTTIEKIRNRLQGKEWLKIEVVTEYHEMLGGKIRLFSVDLKYSCDLKDEEKGILENSKSEIINNFEFEEQNDLINYVANYYAVHPQNVVIVGTVVTKDHFD